MTSYDATVVCCWIATVIFELQFKDPSSPSTVQTSDSPSQIPQHYNLSSQIAWNLLRLPNATTRYSNHKVWPLPTI